MRADPYPVQVLLVTLAAWVSRHHQQHVIAYLLHWPASGPDAAEDDGGRPWDDALR